MKLAEIAKRITAHLKAAEADKEWNTVTYESHKHGAQTMSRLYMAGAWPAGRYVKVVYVTYQGGTALSKADALAYLEWLDAGNRGRHYDQQRESGQ